MDTIQIVSSDVHTYFGWFASAGVSAVVGALAGWLGSLWKARILQREQAALTKRMTEEQQRERAAHERLLAQLQQNHEHQMATLRQENEILTRKVEAQLSKVTLVHRVRFEKEFSAYQQAWAAMINVVSIALSFRPTYSIGPVILDLDKRKRYQEEDLERKLRLYSVEEKKLFDVFQAQKPFFDPAVYTQMDALLRELRNEEVGARLFAPDSQKDYYELGRKNCENITTLVESTCVAIRTRIAQMSVIDAH